MIGLLAILFNAHLHTQRLMWGRLANSHSSSCFTTSANGHLRTRILSNICTRLRFWGLVLVRAIVDCLPLSRALVAHLDLPHCAPARTRRRLYKCVGRRGLCQHGDAAISQRRHPCGPVVPFGRWSRCKQAQRPSHPGQSGPLSVSRKVEQRPHLVAASVCAQM